MTMTMEKDCLFNKYGFCKFRETCHKIHYTEICDDESCETSSCPKRHPRKYKYFETYNRCKFGRFCFFSHKKTDVTSLNEVEELKVKIASLENHVDKLEDTIKLGNAQIKNLEEKNKHLENQIESAIDSMKEVFKVAVKKAIENVTDMILKQQVQLRGSRKKILTI